MVNENFYLNNKLVSVHLYHMEDYDKYVWTNEYYKEKFFGGKRKYKIKEYRWLRKQDHENLLFIDDINDTATYKTDEELMADINPIGVNIDSIRHGKKLYRNPKVVFMYVNGDKRTYYFDNNSDAEKFYTNFKAKYKENEYLIFN